MVGCCTPEQGLDNVRGDAGGRLVALFRKEVFCVNPLEVSDSGEVASMSIKVSQRKPGAVVNLT